MIKTKESFNLEKEDESPIQYVNLDTSTLVALSSDVCNGKLDHIFRNGSPLSSLFIIDLSLLLF